MKKFKLPLMLGIAALALTGCGDAGNESAPATQERIVYVDYKGVKDGLACVVGQEDYTHYLSSCDFIEFYDRYPDRRAEPLPPGAGVPHTHSEGKEDR